MIDEGEADDKIIAVMQRDAVFGEAQDISDIPDSLIERLQHYFSTYKMVPGVPFNVTISGSYGRDHALLGDSAPPWPIMNEEYGSSAPVPDGLLNVVLACRAVPEVIPRRRASPSPCPSPCRRCSRAGP